MPNLLHQHLQECNEYLLKFLSSLFSFFFLLLFSFKQKRMEYFLTPFPIFFFDSTIRRFQNYTIWINTVLYLALPKEENLPKISSWGIPWSNRHHQEWSGPFLLSQFSILNSQFSILNSQFSDLLPSSSLHQLIENVISCFRLLGTSLKSTFAAEIHIGEGYENLDTNLLDARRQLMKVFPMDFQDRPNIHIGVHFKEQSTISGTLRNTPLVNVYIWKS